MRAHLRQHLTTALVLGILAVPASAFAQSPDSTRREQAGRGFFEVGYMGLDLRDLNAALVSAGLPQLEEQYLTLGGAGFGQVGRWLIGGQGAGLLGQHRTTTDGSYDVSLGGGYGMFRLGYNVLSQGNLDLFPSLGIGGGGMQLEIRGRSAPTFGEVLAAPGRSSRMSTGAFIMGVGVDGNYRILLGRTPKGESGGMLIGFSAGYMFSPWTSAWELDNLNSVAGGPSAKIEGLYARFSIGGWGTSPGVK